MTDTHTVILRGKYRDGEVNLSAGTALATRINSYTSGKSAYQVNIAKSGSYLVAVIVYAD